MAYEVTIVSAFFDIGRGKWGGKIGNHAIPGWLVRSNETYLDRFTDLAPLQNQMIIFTQAAFAEAIFEIRRSHNLDDLTSVVVCDELFGPTGLLADRVDLLRSRMRVELHNFVLDAGCPEYWNADYVMLNALKSVFVCTAIRLKLIGCSQAAWVDFGYCRDNHRFEPGGAWLFDCGDRMNLFYIRAPDERPIFDIVRTGDVYFQGCHIVGPVGYWPRFSELIDEAIVSLLKCGLVDDDQTALLMAYRRTPGLFRIHAVDPSDWFVLFRNFGWLGDTTSVPVAA